MWTTRILQGFSIAVLVAAIIQVANGGFGDPTADWISILISASVVLYTLFVLDIKDDPPPDLEAPTTKQPNPEETAALPALMLR